MTLLVLYFLFGFSYITEHGLSQRHAKLINLTILLDWSGWFDWFDGDETMLGVLRKAAGIFFYRSKSVEELTLLPPIGLELGPHTSVALVDQ
jgi:hypothetical protein